MAAIKFKHALGVDRSCEEAFGGIDRTARGKSSNRCYLLENLEPRADGSLKTRAGYKKVFDFSGEMRGSFNSAGKLYSVIGSSLVLTDTSIGTYQVLATLPTETGEADVFGFGGDIYVHDGATLYRYNGTDLVEAEGYAPLYGYHWDPAVRGDIHEDINILSDRIRISYLLTVSANSFDLGINVASVDRVELNGKEYSLEELEIAIDESDSSIIHSTNLPSSSLLELWLTLSPEASHKHRLQKETKSFVFGNNGGERLCLYNPGISGHLLCSMPIGKSAHAASQKSASGALPIYLPISSSVCIGSGASPITGMAQHYGRALLFTDRDTWCVDWEDDELDSSRTLPRVFLLNSAIGAEYVNGTAYFENDPITYFCGGLWRWNSRSGERDECSASLISDEVASLLPRNSDTVSMLSLPQKQKIIIADAEDSEGKMLVYDTARKSWSLYTSVFAERLLHFGDHPAFSRGGEIYVFSDDLAEDVEDDESFKVKSRLTSHFLDFGCPERMKKNLCLILCCDLSGDKATITFENELGEKREIILEGKRGGGEEQFTERISLPRFKKLRYTVEADDPVILYGAILSAK